MVATLTRRRRRTRTRSSRRRTRRRHARGRRRARTARTPRSRPRTGNRTGARRNVQSTPPPCFPRRPTVQSCGSATSASTTTASGNATATIPDAATWRPLLVRSVSRPPVPEGFASGFDLVPRNCRVVLSKCAPVRAREPRRFASRAERVEPQATGRDWADRRVRDHDDERAIVGREGLDAATHRAQRGSTVESVVRGRHVTPPWALRAPGVACGPRARDRGADERGGAVRQRGVVLRV
jgi:hypothetical protein